MLLDVVEQELECGKRIVAQNKDWLVIVPFWAVWPFETMILPKRYIASLNSITNVSKFFCYHVTVPCMAIEGC